MVEKEESEAFDPFTALYDLGLIIFQDDAHDLAKGPFHTAEEIAKGESPVHHWFVGAAICLISAIGKIYWAYESSQKAYELLSPDGIR